MKKLKKIMSIILSVLCIASVFCGSTISVECKEYDFDASTNNIKLESGFEEVELEQNNISEENSNVERFFAVLEESKLNSGAQTGEYWKAFSSPYYTYANKLSQGQKELYDRLYNTLYNLIESEYDFQIYEGLYYTPAVEFQNLTVEQVNDVATLMLYEHPELFYLNNRILVNYSGNNGTVRISIYDDFADGENRIALANQMKDVIAFYLSYVDGFSTLLDKEKACHDIIAAQTFYDLNCKYGQSCASVFLEKKSVCAGYSEAFCMLCNARGIPAISVTSDNHEWSEVKLGKYWYAVDVTWDDCYGSKYYLNKSDEGLKWIDTELYRDYRNCHIIENCWNRIGREACLYDYGNEPEVTVYNGIDYSKVYDYRFYIDKYPDLKNAFGDNPNGALSHFVNYGIREGRQAISTFDVVSYRNQYKDLRLAYGYSNLASYYYHYLNCGYAEGRCGYGCKILADPITTYCGVDYSKVYDYFWYNNYNDLKNVFHGDDLLMIEHFVKCGMNEGRQAKGSFNYMSYKNAYSDIRNIYGDNKAAYYWHYMNWGASEGRVATGYENRIVGYNTNFFGTDISDVYDMNYYLAMNSDVKKAFGYDENAVLVHFVLYGMNEGRVAKRDFDVNVYKNNYADLRNCFGNNLFEYYIHYIKFGKKEGRIAV